MRKTQIADAKKIFAISWFEHAQIWSPLRKGLREKIFPLHSLFMQPTYARGFCFHTFTFESVCLIPPICLFLFLCSKKYAWAVGWSLQFAALAKMVFVFEIRNATAFFMAEFLACAGFAFLGVVFDKPANLNKCGFHFYHTKRLAQKKAA